MYDRMFVLNGPVVKTYKNSDPSDKKHDIQYEMDFSIFDKNNEVVTPHNILLYDNENSMVFTNNEKTKLY
jgi:hypothetical protein